MVPAAVKDVTLVLSRVERGDSSAANELLSAVYAELRALAQDQLARERPGHTLQATALVHEAYLKMVNQRDARWESRAHFFAAAARAMRRVLVDHARTKGRLKRGGGGGGGRGGNRVPLWEAEGVSITDTRETVDLVALDDALVRLAALDETAARVVDMRFFAGMQVEEIALALGVTDRTVRRHWTYGRAWLYRALAEEPAAPLPPETTA